MWLMQLKKCISTFLYSELTAERSWGGQGTYLLFGGIKSPAFLGGTQQAAWCQRAPR